MYRPTSADVDQLVSVGGVLVKSRPKPKFNVFLTREITSCICRRFDFVAITKSKTSACASLDKKTLLYNYHRNDGGISSSSRQCCC